MRKGCENDVRAVCSAIVIDEVGFDLDGESELKIEAFY